MKKEISMTEVAGEIYQSILATPKQQRRLLSKTFWEKFGVQKRTAHLIESVRQALMRQGIKSNLDSAVFGQEAKNEWIILMCDPPIAVTASVDASNVPRPQEEWFSKIASKKFESEREIEYYFVMPLLEMLGYSEDDIYVGYPVTMYEGVSPVKKEADFVIFNGSSRDKENILLVIEAKASSRTKALTLGSADGQAKGYSRELAAPYYLVTNANQTHLWRNRGGLKADEQLLNFELADLRKNWTSLYQHTSKAAVVEYKAKLDEVLTKNNM